jgi:hypothetical protein
MAYNTTYFFNFERLPGRPGGGQALSQLVIAASAGNRKLTP